LGGCFTRCWQFEPARAGGWQRASVEDTGGPDVCWSGVRDSERDGIPALLELGIAVRWHGPGGDEIAGPYYEAAVNFVEADGRGFQVCANTQIPSPAVGSVVARDEHTSGTQLGGERRDDQTGIAGAHVEPGSSIPQASIEAAKGFKEERGAIRARPAALQERRIEDEYRIDIATGVYRSGQRRVVVEAEVPPEPDDRGHDAASGAATARTSGIR